MIRTRIAFCAVATAALLVLPQAADAHFLWMTLERSESARNQATLRVCLNEDPVPGGTVFLKFVRNVKPTAADVPVPVTADFFRGQGNRCSPSVETPRESKFQSSKRSSCP